MFFRWILLEAYIERSQAYPMVHPVYEFMALNSAYVLNTQEYQTTLHYIYLINFFFLNRMK